MDEGVPKRLIAYKAGTNIGRPRPSAPMPMGFGWAWVGMAPILLFMDGHGFQIIMGGHGFVNDNQ